jgi:stage II sporulation protein D
MRAASRALLLATVAALLLPGAAAAGTIFLLDGRGWGHGVGMSQWGAEGAARHGWDYRRILAHYYTGTKLELQHPTPVRVLLGDGRGSARIGSAAPFVVEDAKGHKLRFPARSVVVDRRLLLQKKKLAPPLRFRAGAQPLTYDQSGYRGDLVVKRHGDVLTVVNELPLDRYLRGVVPWEVPRGWHSAAYKAQAVAARTYALATLHPGEDYDLYPDTRDQMYGGIRAERPQTNLAIGATAGEVLTYGGRPITAYYFSTSGGRTADVRDVWPRARAVPYLVSVADPYDYYSPRHVWPTRVLTPSALGAKLGVQGVVDAVAVPNRSGRAAALRVRTTTGSRTIPAQAVREKLGLGSTDFRLNAMSLEEPAQRALYGEQVKVTGWVRGLGAARLQIWDGHEWRVVTHVHTRADGRFSVPVRANASTRLRLAYNGFAGGEVALQVAPRLAVDAAGTRLQVRVAPALPVRIERLTENEWRPVARATGSFARELEPGSYRVAVAGGARYLSSVSRPVGLRRSDG